MQRIDRFTITSICQRRPYQERYWWSRIDYRIVGTGTEATGLFSWRGLLIQQTGDYEIWRPFSMNTDGFVDTVRLGSHDHRELVYTGPLTEDVIQNWLDAVVNPSPWRSPSKPFDEIPWDLHRISDRTARLAAIESFLDAH